MTQTLLPGDAIPALALPDSTGALFDLQNQGIADTWRILVLGRPPAPARLSRAEPQAAARRAGIYLIAGAKPDGTVRKERPKRLFDPERRLFAALGLPEGGVAVLSPRARIGFVRAGAEALEAALDWLPDSSAAAPEAGERSGGGRPRRGGAPVLLVPDILERELRDRLIAHWEAGEKAKDRVASGAGAATAAAGQAQQRLKRRADVLLDDRVLYEAFRQRLERRVLPEMWRAFRFRPARFEAPRIGCYDAADAGAFGAHRDNRTPYTAHRRFAMSLNLNTGEYEGGALRFGEFGDETYEPEAGGAAIFCCDLLHEALPVSRGRRFAIFTFFTDAEGAEQERRLMAEAAARGERGVQLR